MPIVRWFERLSSFAVLMIAGTCALFMRLLLLGSKSLWLDEAMSLRVAGMGQEALWAGRSELYHPPLYYAFVNWWAQWGHSEFFLRLSSALLGTISVLLLFWLASALFDKEIATSALWLAAFSPLLIWYSQEFRSYALVGALTLGSLLSMVIFMRGSHWLAWLLFAFSTLTALYTHYTAFLLLPLQLIVLVLLKDTKRNATNRFLWWLMTWLLVMIGYVPWLRSPTATRFLDLLLGDKSYVSNLMAVRVGVSYTHLLVVLALLLLTGLIVFQWLIRPYVTTPDRLRERPWVQLVFGVLFVLLLVLEVIPRGYSLKRQLTFIWPVILLGFAWLWPWGRVNKKRFITLLIFSALASLVNIAAIPKDDWRQAAAHVAAQKEVTDVVVLQPEYMYIPFNYYDEGATTRIPFSEDKIGTLLSENKRIWLLSQTRDVVDVNHSVERWFKGNATEIEQTHYYNLTVTLYRK